MKTTNGIQLTLFNWTNNKVSSIRSKISNSSVHSIKNNIHSNRALHLFSMLTNSTIWYRKIICKWSFLLDKSHIGFKQRHFNGTRYLPNHFCWVDASISSSSWVFETKLTTWRENIVRTWKRIGSYFLFRLSCRSNLVWSLWQRKHNAFHQYGTYSCSINDGRSCRNFVRWDA